MDHSRTKDQQAVDTTSHADGRGSVAGGTVVGTTAEDGVLLAADTRSSRGTVVRSEGVQKLSQVHPTAVVGSPDPFDPAASFLRRLDSETDRYEISHGEPMDVTALGNIVATSLRESSLVDTTFLLGGVDADGAHLFRLGPDGGTLELTYTAIGSGRQVASGVLDAEHPGPFTMAAARPVAGRAIRSAAERDGQTGVGIHVAEVSDDGVEIHRHDAVEDFLDGC